MNSTKRRKMRRGMSGKKVVTLGVRGDKLRRERESLIKLIRI